MRAFLAGFIGALSCSLLAPARADASRRFFDFTPVSVANPVVATIDGTIQIPLSELRAYRNTERLQAAADSLAQKRAILDDLISEYLYVDEAYRTGVAVSPGFTRQMAATRTMILTDFMSTRARDAKGQTPDEARDAASRMADRLFEAANIDISNEAYAILKRAAQLVDRASAASKQGPADSADAAAAKLHAIVNAAPDAVAVRFADKTISIRQILVIYAGLPAPRPDIQTPEGFVAMIKPFITPELMALEAVKQGVAADPAFQDKLIQNQNALLRFHMQDVIERQASAQLEAPGAELQLRAWYEAHKAEYTTAAGGPEQRVLPFDEVRDRVEGEYSVVLRDRLLAEKARALRKARAVAIDEAVLQDL